jgi:Na+-transporting NADH:ubiquinone oxidoreductase subunit F
MLIQIFVPVAVFTLIIVALSALVLFARGWLSPSGSVSIEVEGVRTIRVGAGDQLLWSLANNGIYLAAACGGRGSCGQCRVTVLSGGGPLLPAEAAHISPQEAEQGMRLACMVKVRSDMRVRMPAGVRAVGRWDCVVASNRNVSTFLKELVLQLPAGQRIDFAAGDYILLEAPPYRLKFRDIDIDSAFLGEWQRHGLFELESFTHARAVRAYSLANPPAEGDRIVLVVRIATPPISMPAAPPGEVSSFIFGLKPGDRVAASGPFGDFHIAPTEREIVFIAGGAGIAPIRSMVLDMLGTGTKRKMSLWYGARNRLDLCYEDEFEAADRQHGNFEYRVALSSVDKGDDWSGYTGFIHSVVYEQYLQNHPAPDEVEYYLCGPPLMSSAVVQMLESLGVSRGNIFFDDFGS